MRPRTTLPCCWSTPLAHARIGCPPGTKGPLQTDLSLCFCFGLLHPRSRNSHFPLLNIAHLFTTQSHLAVQQLFIPEYVQLFPSCHTRTWSSRRTQCHHQGQLFGCWTWLPPAFTLRSSVYEWQTIWITDYHQPVRQFSIILMARNIQDTMAQLHQACC